MLSERNELIVLIPRAGNASRASTIRPVFHKRVLVAKSLSTRQKLQRHPFFRRCSRTISVIVSNVNA